MFSYNQFAEIELLFNGSILWSCDAKNDGNREKRIRDERPRIPVFNAPSTSA